MYVTTRYVGTQRGQVDYLFLLLTEDYIEENRKIAEGLTPILNKFAQKLDDKGTLVRPFSGDEGNTLGDATRKPWGNEMVERMRRDLPALLMIDVDFDDFDPSRNQYMLLSLRESIDKSGEVDVFRVHELLDALADGARTGNLFEKATECVRARQRELALKAVELKPGAFGFTLDLKKAVEFLRSLWGQRQSRR